MDVISKGFTLHKSSYRICKILQHVEKLTQLVLMRFYSLLKCESSENMSIAYVLPWKQTSDVMSLLWCLCGKDITSLSWVWDQVEVESWCIKEYHTWSLQVVHKNYFTITYMKIKIKSIYKLQVQIIMSTNYVKKHKQSCSRRKNIWN